MATKPQAARPPEQRSAENARYRRALQGAGIIKIVVLIPADRLPQLKGLVTSWREEAKLLLESDRPLADQILQIHSVCYALRLTLPQDAFSTRAKAAEWLFAHQAKLGALRPPTLKFTTDLEADPSN